MEPDTLVLRAEALTKILEAQMIEALKFTNTSDPSPFNILAAAVPARKIKRIWAAVETITYMEQNLLGK